MVVLTERLRLEPISERHGDDLHALSVDPGIAEWWGVGWSRSEAQDEARRLAAGWETHGISKWMAYRRATGELVGRGGMTRIPVDGEVRLEVGWAVRGHLWGQGFATEIGEASLDVAFDRLDAEEVVAFTEPHNARSRQVMERLAMTYRRDIDHDGERFVLYGIARDQHVHRRVERATGSEQA